MIQVTAEQKDDVMADSKPGMNYQEGRDRVARIVKGAGNIDAKRNLANSIVNQVRVREGERAAHEIRREFSR